MTANSVLLCFQGLRPGVRAPTCHPPLLRHWEQQIENIPWWCRYSFICQEVPRPGDSEVTFAVIEQSYFGLLPIQLLKGRGNPVKCLAQGHNKRTCQPISTLSLFMLNVKQGSCEYQLLKYRILGW